MIQATGNTPVPFMLLLRRMGRERQARLPIDEARAVDAAAVRRLRVLLRTRVPRQQPRRRAGSGSRSGARSGKNDVALLPLPTGARDLQRLKRLFRYDIYRRHYAGAPATRRLPDGASREPIAANPHWLDEQLARIAARAREDAALRLRRAATRASIDADPGAAAEDATPAATARREEPSAWPSPGGSTGSVAVELPRDRATGDPAHPVISVEHVSKRYGDFVAVERRQLRHPPRRVLLDARPVRLRQDDDAAHDRRLRGA